MCQKNVCVHVYQKEVSFVFAVGDVFHMEGNDVFCVASENFISCPEDENTQRSVNLINGVCV